MNYLYSTWEWFTLAISVLLVFLLKLTYNVLNISETENLKEEGKGGELFLSIQAFFLCSSCVDCSLVLCMSQQTLAQGTFFKILVCQRLKATAQSTCTLLLNASGNTI